jgi:hypothetical protein
MPYCIYTDRDVPQESGNFDHIVPLSLGGLDRFWTWCDRDYNSQIGSRVDGAVANDFLVMLARRDADARGHSNKPPVPVWKRSEIDGKPIQVKLAKEKIEGWDPRARATIPEEDLVGKQITSSLTIDKFAAMRFASKVALGAAYFIYGDMIKTAIDCEELRKLIALDPEKARADPTLIPDKVTVCDRFHPDANGASADGSMFRALCEFTSRSTIIAVPHADSISFHIGVIGMFLASVICPADTTALPNDGVHDLGHAVLLAPGTLERLSLREIAHGLNPHE